MEYVDIFQERIETREREMAAFRRENEARRLGFTLPGPFAQFDGLLIRVAKGASRRQARRDYNATRERLLS